MKLLVTFLFIFSTTCYSKILTPQNNNNNRHNEVKEILNNIFYEQLYERVKDLKIPKTKSSKTSINEGKRGKMIIEQIKQKNREKLAKIRGFDPDQVKSAKDLVNLQKEDNKEVLKKISKLNLENIASEEIERIKRKVLVEHKEWRKKHLATLKNWDEKKKDFLNDVDDYKKTLINIPLILPVDKKELKKEVEIKIEKDFYVIDNAFALDIRDQKKRPTCSSFAGIRAIEILLAQNNQNLDLSEQYFYWSSKPDCRNSRCNIKGSWAGHGLTFSKESKKLDIPLEKNCPYIEKNMSDNETQIPLANNCSNGIVKVNKFAFQNSLDDAITSLKQGKAVIASVKLTPNFYSTKGLILDKESSQGSNMDSHAAGHSILMVGLMKLPLVLNEGKVCFIIDNSWGVGWGYGGHGCISEKWLLNNRSSNPFVSISSVEN